MLENNLLANIKSEMTKLELKAFYQFTKILHMKNFSFPEYEISLNDFFEALNLKNEDKNHIIVLCKNLLQQSFTLKASEDKWHTYMPFSSILYEHDEQKIFINFNKDIEDLLIKIKNLTKTQEIKYLKNFDSKYAVNMYILLDKHKLLSEVEIILDDLKNEFNLPKSYRDFSYINEYVLKPSIKEINKKSNLEITEIIPKKEGKKIVSILIKFQDKAEKLSIDLSKYLQYLYRKNGGDFNTFLGYFCTYNKEKLDTNQIYKIIQIQEEDSIYKLIGKQLNKENIEPVILHQATKKNIFLQKIYEGIYYAIKYKLEHEKTTKVSFIDSESSQGDLIKAKEILALWKSNWQNEMSKKIKINYLMNIKNNLEKAR